MYMHCFCFFPIKAVFPIALNHVFLSKNSQNNFNLPYTEKSHTSFHLNSYLQKKERILSQKIRRKVLICEENINF